MPEKALVVIDPIGGRPEPRRPRMASIANGFTGAMKRFTKMVFSKSTWRMSFLPGSRFDYETAVGDLTNSCLVAAVLNWIARTFPEAAPALWQEDDDGDETRLRQHPLLKLLRKPNPFFTGLTLWMATVTDWMADGNAYWLKVRDNGGEVRELWWVPRHLIEPKGDGGAFITHYEYTPDSEPLRIESSEIVHFRFGADPDNPKKGYSQLRSVLREVYTDNEAANFTASLLKNMGVPGIVVSPEKGVTMNVGDADSMKEYVKEKFGGDKRGEAMVMTGATKIEQFGFSPEQLLLRELRRIPEERVSAATGIPAIVVGFGAGLERSTFTNMGEARAAAYEAGLIPMQRIMAEEILFQLLTDFEEDVYAFRFGFDYSRVSCMQEELTQLAHRWNLMVQGGWAKVSEARRAVGLDVAEDGSDEVYLRMINEAALKSADEVPPDPGGPQQPNGNQPAVNGHAREPIAA